MDPFQFLDRQCHLLFHKVTDLFNIYNGLALTLTTHAYRAILATSLRHGPTRDEQWS